MVGLCLERMLGSMALIAVAVSVPESADAQTSTTTPDAGSPSPTVRTSPPTVAGLLSSHAIRGVVSEHLAQVQACYERGLANNPTAQGHVVVRFIIGGTGRVLASAVASATFPVPSVGQCIAAAVRTWTFPSPEGGGIVTVNYPFELVAR